MSDIEKQRITAALASVKGGDSLHELAMAFKSEDMSQTVMYTLFDSFRLHHEKDPDEKKYNVILDTMDFIAGHCSAGEVLFPEIPITGYIYVADEDEDIFKNC